MGDGSGGERTGGPEPDLEEGAGEAGSDAFWDDVRDQFPLDRQRVYLNTGALGPSPWPVIRAVQEHIEQLEHSGETGRGQELWEALKAKAAELLGGETEEIAFTRNTTEGVNVVCHGLPLQAGDEVITTTHEHVGGIVPWLSRRDLDGVVVRALDPDADTPSLLARIAALLTDRTRVVSVPHVSCATGQELPLAAIGELAEAHGLWYFVDGAQAPGAVPVDVAATGCHAYATSGHKWLMGPKGTGLLWVRRDAQEVIRARWAGAYSCHWSGGLPDRLQFVPSAQRYEFGTPNVPLFVGLGAAIDFVQQIGVDRIWQHDRALTLGLAHGLRQLGAQLLTPARGTWSTAILTFRLPGRDTVEVQSHLMRQHGVRSRRVYEGGVDGIRLTPHVYNGAADVQRVLEGVAGALDGGVGRATAAQ